MILDRHTVQCGTDHAFYSQAKLKEGRNSTHFLGFFPTFGKQLPMLEDAASAPLCSAMMCSADNVAKGRLPCEKLFAPAKATTCIYAKTLCRLPVLQSSLRAHRSRAELCVDNGALITYL
jgi:hypothetical protein